MINPFYFLFNGFTDLLRPVFGWRSSYRSGRSPKILDRHVDRVNIYMDEADRMLKRAADTYKVKVRRQKRR